MKFCKARAAAAGERVNPWADGHSCAPAATAARLSWPPGAAGHTGPGTSGLKATGRRWLKSFSLCIEKMDGERTQTPVDRPANRAQESPSDALLRVPAAGPAWSRDASLAPPRGSLSTFTRVLYNGYSQFSTVEE